ncbi:MAG TPA: hypothetical protein VFP68_22780 [Burkholderiaceae bacterium]|nr:hypothetical protein [Burkholderiaceae bacterium]
MKQPRYPRIVFGIMLAFAAIGASAQGDANKSESPTRAQVKMERDEFLKTHQWDEDSENWVLKKGMEPPAGVKPRSEVKAEREKFLSSNRWDEPSSAWVPVQGTPRNLSTMSKQEVKAETRQFLRTHEWDEQKGQWVERRPLRKK